MPRSTSPIPVAHDPHTLPRHDRAKFVLDGTALVELNERRWAITDLANRQRHQEFRLPGTPYGAAVQSFPALHSAYLIVIRDVKALLPRTNGGSIDRKRPNVQLIVGVHLISTSKEGETFGNRGIVATVTIPREHVKGGPRWRAYGELSVRCLVVQAPWAAFCLENRLYVLNWESNAAFYADCSFVQPKSVSTEVVDDDDTV